MKTRALAFLAFLAVGAMLGGCFALREPEAPGTAGTWTSPTQPSILLENFDLAVTTLNPVNYERCFAPNLHFIPDPATAGSASGVFDNWTLAEERIYLARLKESSSVATANQLVFTGKQEVFFNADSLEINTRYTLNLQHEDTTFRHYHFAGAMRLILRRRQNGWQILSWQDNRNSDSLCWTDLKKHFYAP